METQLNIKKAVGAVTDETEAEYSRPVGWKDFVYLTKPGIIFSNLITTFGGFWIAAKWQVNWLLMVYTLLGTALVMASGTVLNNYLDRDMDTKMTRTRKRTLPSGKMHPKTVLYYGVGLGIAGICPL